MLAFIHDVMGMLMSPQQPLLSHSCLISSPLMTSVCSSSSNASTNRRLARNDSTGSDDYLSILFFPPDLDIGVSTNCSDYV